MNVDILNKYDPHTDLISISFLDLLSSDRHPKVRLWSIVTRRDNNIYFMPFNHASQVLLLENLEDYDDGIELEPE